MPASLIRSVAPLAISSGLYWALPTSVFSCCSFLTSCEHIAAAPLRLLSCQSICSSRWKPVNWDFTVTGFS
ncbi:MAG TPA: hypothetical protein VFW50_37020 [Streptosporangiaceae bacterium]|nr:hypothetical protein [Streptosporangiaceae bacterium]